MDRLLCLLDCLFLRKKDVDVYQCKTKASKTKGDHAVVELLSYQVRIMLLGTLSMMLVGIFVEWFIEWLFAGNNDDVVCRVFRAPQRLRRKMGIINGGQSWLVELDYPTTARPCKCESTSSRKRSTVFRKSQGV